MIVNISYSKNYLKIILNEKFIIKQYYVSNNKIYTYMYIIHILFKLGVLKLKNYVYI